MKNNYVLEIQNRGESNVLYIHSKISGRTIIRICGLSSNIEETSLDVSIRDGECKCNNGIVQYIADEAIKNLKNAIQNSKRYNKVKESENGK